MIQLESPRGNFIKLPELHELKRPLYAYPKLPQGWNLLQREVFGNTRALCEELLQAPQKHFSEQDLSEIAHYYHVHSDIVDMLRMQGANCTGQEIYNWYSQWEAKFFEDYLHWLKTQDKAL